MVYFVVFKITIVTSFAYWATQSKGCKNFLENFESSGSLEKKLILSTAFAFVRNTKFPQNSIESNQSTFQHDFFTYLAAMIGTI